MQTVTAVTCETVTFSNVGCQKKKANWQGCREHWY